MVNIGVKQLRIRLIERAGQMQFSGLFGCSGRFHSFSKLLYRGLRRYGFRRRLRECLLPHDSGGEHVVVDSGSVDGNAVGGDSSLALTDIFDRRTLVAVRE